MRTPFQISFPKREIEFTVTLNEGERLALAAYLTKIKRSLPWLVKKLIVDELLREAQPCKP